MGAVAVIAIVVGAFIIFSIDENEISKRGKLLHREKVMRDATIVSAQPKIVGSKNNKHYILIVTFSDGTSYQDKCNIHKNGFGSYTIQFDKEHMEEIVKKALEVHQLEVEKKEKLGVDNDCKGIS